MLKNENENVGGNFQLNIILPSNEYPFSFYVFGVPFRILHILLPTNNLNEMKSSPTIIAV